MSMQSIHHKLHLVTHLEADSNYTYIYYLDGSKQIVSKTLKYILNHISTHHFIRCHAKYAINVDFVQKVKQDRRYGHITLNGHPKSIPISRRKKSNVIAMLGVV